MASTHLPVSPWTLWFHEKKVETAYQKSQYKAATVVTEAWQVAHSGRKIFGAGFLCTWLLMVVSTAGSYGLGHLPRDTCIGQLAVLAVLAGGGCVLLLLAALQRSGRIAFTTYPVLFLFSAVCYAVGDERFITTATDAEYSGSATSGVLPMAVLAAMLPRAISYRYFTYAISAFASVLVFVAFQAAGERLCAGLVDCALYCAFVVWSCTRVYYTELKLRNNFYAEAGRTLVSIKEDAEIETWVPGESSNSDIEGLLKLLREVYQTLSEALAGAQRDYRDRLRAALSVLAELGKGITALSPKDEGGIVTKAVEHEYRMYIEEQFLPVHTNFSPKPRSRSIEYGTHELTPMLNQLEKNWNFDMFFLAQVSGMRPLEVTGHFCIKKYGLDTNLKLNEDCVVHFLQALERRYNPNPYHNSTHAADVLNSLLFLYKQSPIFRELNERELLGSIIAALGHDVGHPAFNNRYLVNTKSSFALMCKCYVDNDYSVLEMMHTALTFELLIENQVLEHLNRDEWQLTRKVIIELILATDMQRHFELMDSFQKKFLNRSLPLPEFEDRIALYRMCMKGADIAHAGKSEALHEKWTLRVVEEFYHQGDNEKDQSLPISMFCDRATSDLPKNQSGFIINIVKPLFAAINGLVRSPTLSTVILAQLDHNAEFWKNKAARQKQKRLSVAPEHLPPEHGSVTTTVERPLTRVHTEEDM